MLLVDLASMARQMLSIPKSERAKVQEELWDALKMKPYYLDVSNVIIGKDEVTSIKLYDYLDNQLPNQLIGNISNNFVRNIEEHKDFRGDLEINLLADNAHTLYSSSTGIQTKLAEDWLSKISTPYSIRQQVKYGEGKNGQALVVDGNKLNVAEQVDIM
jgi:hypothetical protein